MAPAAWTVCPTARLCVPALSRYDKVGVTSDGGMMSTVTLREVVALRVLLELDGPGAARVLGISVTACSTRLSRALQRLEEEMTNVRN